MVPFLRGVGLGIARLLCPPTPVPGLEPSALQTLLCYLVTHSVSQESSAGQMARPRSPSPTWLPWGPAMAWKKEGQTRAVYR